MADKTEENDSRDWRNNINFRNKDIDRLLELNKKKKGGSTSSGKKEEEPKAVNVGLKTLGRTTKDQRVTK